MATALTVLDEPERNCVSCTGETRQVTMLGDGCSPFLKCIHHPDSLALKERRCQTGTIGVII